MTTIKAIPTEYNGCQFRSRTEARWAVFFNMLGIRWEYEVEGFDLPGVGNYLPDFWLPELQYWIEVKGTMPTDLERKRAAALADNLGANVFILAGQPWLDVQHIREPTIDYYTYKAHYTVHAAIGSPRILGWGLSWFEAFMKSLSNDFLPLQKEQGCPFTAEIPKWTGQPSEARQLIELDKEYYRWKYGTVHPRYKFGLGCEATGIIWVDDRYDGLALSNGGHQPDFSEGNVCTNRLMKAYHAARKAQFDRNRRGLPWMETGQVQYSELPY